MSPAFRTLLLWVLLVSSGGVLDLVRRERRPPVNRRGQAWATRRALFVQGTRAFHRDRRGELIPGFGTSSSSGGGTPVNNSQILAKPFVTVSPAQVFDGSDYGGWTNVTGTSVLNGSLIFTNGIQEAINYMGNTLGGGTVILRSSLGAFKGTGSGTYPTLNGVHLLPGVVLTTDRPSFRSSTTNQPGADIIADANFAPDVAWPAASGDPAGPACVIGTNPTSGNVILSGYGIRNLVILITTPQSPCNGIHFSNVNRGTLSEILVHGANLTGLGPNTGTQYPYANSTTGYGGIVLDFFSNGSNQPGEVNLSYLTCEQCLSDGLVICVYVTLKCSNFELSNNGQAGLRLHAVKGMVLNGITANSNNVAGIYGEDDTGTGFHLQKNTISNVSLLNTVAGGSNGIDIVWAPQNDLSGGTTGSRIVGGSAITYAVAPTKGSLISLKINSVDGISNSGLLTANIAQPAVGASTVGVANPFAAAAVILFLTGTHVTNLFSNVPAPPVPTSGSTHTYTNSNPGSCVVTLTGGTGTQVWVNGSNVLTQASGTFTGTGPFTVPAGQTIAIVYTVAPTWSWLCTFYVQANGALPAQGATGLVVSSAVSGLAGATFSAGTYTWQWGNPTAGLVSLAGAVTNLTPFTVTVYVQNTAADAMTIKKNTVQIYSVPAAITATAAVELGPGDTIQLTSAGGSATWQWDTTW